MKTTAAEFSLKAYLAKRLMPGTLAIVFIISIAFPATYYVVGAHTSKQTAVIYAYEFSDEIYNFIVKNPTLWKYQVQKYLHAVHEFVPYKNVTDIRVFDDKGQRITEYDFKDSNNHGHGYFSVCKGTSPIVFNNRVIGTVEVYVSLKSVLTFTFLIFLVSLSVGTGLGYFTYVFPIRVVKEAEEKLRESESKYRDLAELLPQFVFETDDKGTIQFFNRFALENLGYTQEDYDKGLHALQMFTPEDIDRVKENIQKILSGEVISGIEFTALKKDSTTFPVLLSASPIIHKNNITGIRGIAIDISDRKLIEMEIRKLNEELEMKVEKRTKQLIDAQEELVRKEKLATLGQLSGSVGHELRNPMGVISNAVYYLQTVMPDDDETVREYLGIIKSEVNNSERIITDLLDFTRTKTPQTKVITVNELIKQSLGKCSVPANVTLKLDIPETLHSAQVDPLQIGQVFQNLVTNAVQAMLDGGSLTIRAEEDRESGALSISVADTGEGISPENMSKLFQPLFTTKARGIGLGLTVVKNLIEANGGRIEVGSESGKGTTFTVTLPCERA